MLFISKELRDIVAREIMAILFLGGIFPFPVARYQLELKTKPTAEIPIGWDQHDSTVRGSQGNVPLGKEVTAISQEFCVAWDKPWKRLVNPKAQIGIQMIERLAVRIQCGDDRTVDPFVASGKLCSNAGYSCGKPSTRALTIAHRQLVSQGCLRGLLSRGQCARIFVDNRRRNVVRKL